MSEPGIEHRYDELYGHLPQLLVAFHADTSRIVWCNRVFLDATGFTQVELNGCDVLQVLHPEARGVLQNLRTGTLARRPSRDDSLRLVRKDGGFIEVRLRLGRVTASDGVHVHMSMDDGGVVEELDRFLYAASHDLKAPLVTAQGFSRLLLRHLQDPDLEAARDSARFVDRSIGRMGRMLDDLLALSRAGRCLDPEPIDLDDLVRSVCDDLEVQAHTAGAELEVVPGLPRVLADRAATRWVLEQLLANAFEHGCDPAREVNRVTVRGERHGDRARICVADSGPGLASHLHARAFQVFQRMTRKPGGSGVGLAMVDKLARRHGGRAWVESDDGQGATFWVELPAHVAGSSA